MTDEITRLAREYTQETASLRDYQCQSKSAVYGKQKALNILKQCDNEGYDPYYLCNYACAMDIAKESRVEIEEGDPGDGAYYYWALVPECNSHNRAKVVLRRIGTEDGELLLTQEKRAEKRVKLSNREAALLRTRTLKGIIDKIHNYEGQIKNERKRLGEQIRRDDRVYMEAEAVELKRICDAMKEDLDDFLDAINAPV